MFSFTKLKKMFNFFKKKEEQVKDVVETPKKLRISRTVYPPGGKQMSANGKDEWYGVKPFSLEK